MTLNSYPTSYGFRVKCTQLAPYIVIDDKEAVFKWILVSYIICDLIL